MKSHRISVGLIFILISFQSSSLAQLYDFDSLYENSAPFKLLIDNVKDTFDIFNSEEILQVTITSDFRNLIKNKLKDEYQPATLETVMFDTIVIRNEIKIKPRGGIRREQHCYYPPIMLNFSKKRAVFTQFKEFDKVKFVGNCKGGDPYEEYVLQEYYAYKIYNLLSSNSFRVRLLMVTYVDIEGKKKPRSSYAFIIESVDQLARRLNGINHKRENLLLRHLDKETSTMMGLFQLLIANVDWNIPHLHNIKLIKTDKIINPIPVPYDFDYAGIVNAPYTMPGENWPVDDVRKRYYMGPCPDPSKFEEKLKVFFDNRQAIEALYRNTEYLSERTVQSTINYIDDFYEIIENKNAIESSILDNCR